MTQFQHLDVKGDIRSHPFAELLAEIHQNQLNGSLRLASSDKKGVIYFRDGDVVYGATNSRDFRLFNLLLSEKKIDEKTLAQFSDLANDFELAARVLAKGLMTKEEMDRIIVTQVKAAIADALKWPYGAWHFSPLTRLRADMTYEIDVYELLVDYARTVPSETVTKRLRSVEEAFTRSGETRSNDLLQGHESYTLDHFKDIDLTIPEICGVCQLPQAGTLQAVYVLWLCGLLVRKDWNGAFTSEKLDEIGAAKLSLVKQAVKTAVVEKTEEAEPEPATEEITISLEEYLERIEKADTLYEVLGVNQRAPLYEIKNAYFASAKLFHPDRFHREDAAKLRRIQTAFTEIAHAYETLKSEDTREGYNLKMTKEAEYKKKKREAANKKEEVSPEQRQVEAGLESFELALEALNEEEFAAAAGHFARALQCSPQNALYHAYFGKALSQLEKQHHKAESSLQTAVKLDPSNPKIRMMLVEFFVDMKMTRRAIGELNRFLEMAPDNKDAMRMLTKLQASADA